MTEPPDDSGLTERLSAARAGSQEALGLALEDCRCYLLGIVEREVGPDLRAKAGASDLVQQTFLDACRGFAAFQGNSEAELLAWLRQILLHHLGKLARRYRDTQKRQLGREVSLSPAGSSAGPRPEPAAPVESPSYEARARERDEALERALGRLPDDHRLVIDLRYREGRSFEEVAAALGRSLDATRKLWARAVDRLQHELGGES